MTTLVIDTALHCAQAALFDGEQYLAQGMRTSDRGQAEILLPLLGDVLAEAKCGWKDLMQVIVAIGPGVFTGIRTGIAVARALKLALDVPAIGVSTLQVLAAMAAEKNKSVTALIDAHKNEVYAQQFTAKLEAKSQPVLLPCRELPSYVKQAGQVVAYPAAFAKTHELKNAQAVDRLGLAAALQYAKLFPQEALPLYVRAPDAAPQKNAALRRA